MADTIKEKILDNIDATLQTITKANGYNNDIESVQRWSQEGPSLVDVPAAVIVTGHRDGKPEPNPKTSNVLEVFIEIWVRNATDEILNSLEGDVEKALMQDYTRGGYADDTNVLGSDPFEGTVGNPHAGIEILLGIKYKHLQTDPTQG